MPVYHGEHGTRTLKHLMRCYECLVKDITRVKNRLKAIYNSQAIKQRGRELYHWLSTADRRSSPLPQRVAHVLDLAGRIPEERDLGQDPIQVDIMATTAAFTAATDRFSFIVNPISTSAFGSPLTEVSVLHFEDIFISGNDTHLADIFDEAIRTLDCLRFLPVRCPHSTPSLRFMSTSLINFRPHPVSAVPSPAAQTVYPEWFADGRTHFEIHFTQVVANIAVRQAIASDNGRVDYPDVRITTNEKRSVRSRCESNPCG